MLLLAAQPPLSGWSATLTLGFSGLPVVLFSITRVDSHLRMIRVSQMNVETIAGVALAMISFALVVLGRSS